MRSNRPYVQIDPSVIEQARQMDLLSYLQRYEPSTLKRVAGNVYCTKEHDSLKISDGKWYWWSRGFGDYSALDYLIKVKGSLKNDKKIGIFRELRHYIKQNQQFVTRSEMELLSSKVTEISVQTVGLIDKQKQTE